MRSFKALAFDFDMVLADSTGIHTRVRRRVFSELGYEVNDQIHAEAHRHGSHSPQIIGWILKEIGVVAPDADVMRDKTVQQVNSLKSQLYYQEAAAGLPAIPGAVELVNRAVAKYGAERLAIATTATLDKEVQPFLERHQLQAAFGVIVTREDTPDHALKPDPYVYKRAAQLLKIFPENVAGIEDSPAGVEAIKKAGMYAFGITTSHDRTDLQPPADIVVASHAELGELLFAA